MEDVQTRASTFSSAQTLVLYYQLQNYTDNQEGRAEI